MDGVMVWRVAQWSREVSGILKRAYPPGGLCKKAVVLSNEGAIIQATFPFLVLIFLWEGIPKPQSLISCTGDDGFAFRAHGEVQNTMGVP